jgi:hypothetical protein
LSAQVITALRNRAEILDRESREAQQAGRLDIALFRLMLAREFRAVADTADRFGTRLDEGVRHDGT